MPQNQVIQFGLLGLLIVFFYFFLIRPQKKKEKTINEMRNGLSVGDEVITIGGIKGKIVKTKEDSVVIQVGADKVKFEMMRWGISSVVSKSTSAKSKFEEEEEEVRSMPKRLKRASTEDKEAETETSEEN